MFEGIPAFVEFSIDMIIKEPTRDPIDFVLYRPKPINFIIIFSQISDLVHAADLALFHYLTVPLDADFLQNSSRGTPYQKWAEVTNNDFLEFDQCMIRLIQLTAGMYDCMDLRNVKRALYWFSLISEKYSSCSINKEEPSLIVSGFDVYDHFDPTDRQFRPELSEKIFIEFPPRIMKKEQPIADRSVLVELQRIGITRVDEMCASLEKFANWLQENCTMKDITTLPGRSMYVTHRVT